MSEKRENGELRETDRGLVQSVREKNGDCVATDKAADVFLIFTSFEYHHDDRHPFEEHSGNWPVVVRLSQFASCIPYQPNSDCAIASEISLISGEKVLVDETPEQVVEILRRARGSDRW